MAVHVNDSCYERACSTGRQGIKDWKLEGGTKGMHGDVEAVMAWWTGVKRERERERERREGEDERETRCDGSSWIYLRVTMWET